MSDWFHSLPIFWMALIVFGFTYFVVALIYIVVGILAVGERARAFKSVSPGMLPPSYLAFLLDLLPRRSGAIVLRRPQRWTAKPVPCDQRHSLRSPFRANRKIGWML